MGWVRRVVLAASVALAGATATADPVVVELFTSQGCSSCPPVDALMAELAERDEVIALALHVDYWDYLGWEDSFADPAFTARQKRYARAAGSRMIYTPQMIVGGADHVKGFQPMELADLIQAHREAPDPVAVSLERKGELLFVTLKPRGGEVGEVVVQLVRYRPEADVEIERGENAGRTIAYRNIVTVWRPIATWNGRTPMKLAAPISGPEPVVVIAQEAGYGPILAAARLR